jgi:spore maturation protein CgeB
LKRSANQIRILLGHSFPDDATFGTIWIENWLARLRTAGFEVYPFSLVVDQQRPVLYFKELDILWRYQDSRLLAMYERLGNALLDYDAFICFNGSNIHPDFVSSLNCFTVYACFDDPEASQKLSKPVAGAFDLAMVGNIAEVDTYKSWGVKEVRWWPLGFRHDDYDSQLTAETILEGCRDIDVALLCERVTRYRKDRVDRFVKAFPSGAYYGLGWPSGFLAEEKRIPTLQRTRIGINIHNSTGPINFRTFYLPANGVMQLCDNKSNLGKIFELGKEALGYDSIEEAIDLTHYYLDHDAERRLIAAAGWKRALADYNEVACFRRVTEAINELSSAARENRNTHHVDIQPYKSRGKWSTFSNRSKLFMWQVLNAMRLAVRSTARKLLSRYL